MQVPCQSLEFLLLEWSHREVTGVGVGEEEKPPVISLETFREMQGHQP